jgi:benzoyl-CoA reductase/2-hydroxyglutaryl-CoA dehydratase subunit BcrC/BadD/HgdB
MRPESLKLFENFSEKSLLDLDQAKAADRKIAGIYCIFAPSELIFAAGAVPVGLCGKREEPIREAEKTLPANLCPLIKASYGYAASGTCPYFAFSDFIVGETTCDGKKKMYEFLGRIKPLFLMQLPYNASDEGALTFWTQEIHRLKAFLEEQTGNAIEAENVRHYIKVYNRIRSTVSEISRLCADSRIELSGLELMSFFETKGFCVDPESHAVKLETLLQELKTLLGDDSVMESSGPPRILLTGCPIGKGSEKVLRIIEESGARVVCLENCSGIKGMQLPVDEVGDPFAAIAKRYIKVPCSCMTPNQGRLDLLEHLVETYKVQGIVDMTWMFCHTYNIESRVVQDFLQERFGTPFIQICTDYSSSDTEQIRTRIQAFLEMIE